MTGELIPTGVTFGVGRNSINDAFSGTAYMNNIELDSGGNFSAGTGGGVIYSAGTDLYSIFLTTADGNDITRVQPGSNISTGGTGNLPTINVISSPSFNSITASGASSFNTLSATTFFSGSTNLGSIISSYSGTSGNLWSASTSPNSIIANNNTGNEAGSVGGVVTGSGNTISGGVYSTILGGAFNLLKRSFNCTINSQATYNLLAITAPGRDHTLNTVISSRDSQLFDSTGSTMISCSGISLSNLQWVTAMQRAYIDEFIDLNPQTTLPTARLGRIFFSGSPLFKLMINTGGTNADWVIV